MAILGATVRVICRSDRSPSEGRRRWRRLQSCYGDPDERDFRVYMGNCVGAGKAQWTIRDWSTQLGVSGPFRHLHRTILVVLLSRIADWASIQCCTGRQAERGLGDPRRVALPRGTSNAAKDHWGVPCDPGGSYPRVCVEA